MSRVIKFRAWECSPGCTNGMKYLDNSIGFPMSYLVENKYWKVMQFTGLLDRNGVEIYEGDILKRGGKTKIKPFDFGKEVASLHWELTEVVFHSGSFMEIIKAQHNSYFGTLPSEPRRIFRSEEYSEIIGNIHQHPHLLEGGKNG